MSYSIIKTAQCFLLLLNACFLAGCFNNTDTMICNLGKFTLPNARVINIYNDNNILHFDIEFSSGIVFSTKNEKEYYNPSLNSRWFIFVSGDSLWIYSGDVGLCELNLDDYRLNVKDYYDINVPYEVKNNI